MPPRDIESKMEKGQAPDAKSPAHTTTTDSEIYEICCQRKSSFPSVGSGIFKYKHWSVWKGGIFNARHIDSGTSGNPSSNRLKNPEASNEGGNPDSRIIIRKLEDCPEGYPRLAAFLDSDDNFMIYRRFGFLHARVLLHKQDELRELEDKLEAMDEADGKTEAGQLSLRCRARDDKAVPVDGQGPTRKEILAEIGKKLNEYDTLLAKAQRLVSANRPTDRDYESVEIYMDNTKPLVRREALFIHRKEDFVTLRPGRDGAWLDFAVERVLKKLHCRLIEWVFCSEETKAKTDDDRVIYYAKNRVETFVAALITAIILALLVVPTYTLSKLCMDAPAGKVPVLAIGVLMVFTLVFSAILSAFTRARRHEILGASAAYGAVLVVFIGNIKIGK